MSLHCNKLEHTANALQQTGTHCQRTAPYALHHTVTHCNIYNTLQYAATHCQHTALQQTETHCQRTAPYATCCITLPHTANTLLIYCFATYWNTLLKHCALPHIVTLNTPCKLLQQTATRYNHTAPRCQHTATRCQPLPYTAADIHCQHPASHGTATNWNTLQSHCATLHCNIL